MQKKIKTLHFVTIKTQKWGKMSLCRNKKEGKDRWSGKF
jgi:hypothetical protein